jgi:hypothetical protein
MVQALSATAVRMNLSAFYAANVAHHWRRAGDIRYETKMESAVQCMLLGAGCRLCVEATPGFVVWGVSPARPTLGESAL